MISHNIWGPLPGRPDPSPETIKQSRRWISINISTSKCPHRHLGTVGPIFQVIQWVAGRSTKVGSSSRVTRPIWAQEGRLAKQGFSRAATHLLMPASALPRLNKNGYSKIRRARLFLGRLHLLTPVGVQRLIGLGRLGPKDPHSVRNHRFADLPRAATTSAKSHAARIVSQWTICRWVRAIF